LRAAVREAADIISGEGEMKRCRILSGAQQPTGSDGIVRSHAVSEGGTNTAECSAATVGLTLVDAKRALAGLQDNLVQAQAEEYWR
jgi:hypothetical protein